ncbi:MAG: hypothetical protein K0R00_3212 [Herbinix sp.]|jgi:hypothetical protein|nr:hypothetical protein [Herbinix sp.]
MVAYLVNQIILGKLTYLQVITSKPELKEGIDKYITDNELTIDKTK